MARSTRLVVLAASMVFLPGVGRRESLAQPPAAEATSTESPPSEIKALAYHELLRKRPEPGYLFDRFYNTWLDEATVDELQQFLTDQVQESATTADRLLLAFFYVKQGDDVAALEEFRQALANDPASAATWYHKALVEARTLDFETAIADLRKAREQQPDDKLALDVDKQLGKLLVRNGQSEAALEVWRALVTAHPDDEELQEDVIELEIDEGLFDEAAKMTEQLIERTKDPYLAVTRRLRLGDIHYRGGDRQLALDVYTAALDEVGYDTWLERQVLAQIEQIFRREDDLAGLRTQYAELLEAHGRRIAVHRRHAQLLAEMGDGDEAIAAFQKILELTPGDRANREEYVALLAKLDRHEPAVKELEALCTQHADDAELRFRLANLRHQANQNNQVAGEVQRYLELSDGSEYAYLRAARLLEQLDQKDDARQVYEKMAEVHAESPSAREAYAAFLYKEGEKDKALAIWRELAKDADLNQTLHIARELTNRHEHEAVLEMLVARQDDFDREPLFFGQLTTTAVALKKYEEAIPWALRRVELSLAVTELETAIGQAATVLERADKLEEVARQLAARDARSVSETCLLAELWEEIGDSQKADAVLAEPAAAGQLLAVSQQIRLFSQRREWNAAADATRRILELPGGQKSLHVRRLVELYTRDYQLAEALRWIDPWKQLSPGSTAPWRAESRLLRLEGKEDDALAVLRKACQRFEDDEDLRARLAQFYTEVDKPGDAERIYWQLYEQTEDLFGKLRWVGQLAKLSEQQGKTAQLVESFEERSRNNRRSIVPLLALAEVHREADDYEGRRRALTAASQIKADDPNLLFQIARIEEGEGDWQAALATLQRAAKIDNTNRTRERIARLHLEYGEPEDGYAILYELAGGEESDPRAIESIADAMCSMDEWDRAVEFLRGRLDDHPHDYRLRYLYGVALEEMGEVAQAADVFVDLLADQEELPTKSQNQQFAAQSLNSYLGLLKQLAPGDTGDWIQLSQYRYTVYSYQQRQRTAGAVLSLGGGPSRSGISIPNRVEDVRTYALTHLVNLGGMMAQEEADELAGEMASRGVRDAKYVLKLGSDQNAIAAAVTEILDEDPRHETALAVHVLLRFSLQQPGMAEHSARAFEVFRESHPELAIMAAVQAAAQDKQYASLIEPALELADQVAQPSPLSVISLVSAVGGPPFGQQTQNEFDDDARRTIVQLMLKWYPHMQRSPQYSTWSFLYVMSALRNAGEPEVYVNFLEDEVAAWHSGSGRQSGQQIASMFGRGHAGALLVPLDFPPGELVDFPSHVLAMLRDPDNSNPYSQLMQRGGQAWDNEAMEPLVEQVKDPVLRLLLARQLGRDELIDGTLADLLKADPPRVDAYLLAAGWASEKSDDLRAGQLLEKVRYLPMSRELRQQVDAALVAIATATSADDDEGQQLKEAGRKAALRLRRGRLDANQRTELIAAMEELGLTKEAEKLERVAAQAPALPATPTVVYSTATTGGNVQQDRIAKLLEQGKRETAVKLMAREVASQAQQLAMNIYNYSYRHQQFEQVAQRVKSFSMLDDVLKELDPGESNNLRRWSDYATACELFGKIDLARAGYEKILERRPKDDNTRMQLVMLLADSDADAVDAELEKLSDASGQMFGQIISNSLQDFRTPLAKRLDYVRIGYRYFLVIRDRPRAQLSWVENLLEVMARQMNSNGRNMPSMYAVNSSNRQRASSDLLERRAKLHDDLCREMLESPQTARSGFRHLLAAAEAKDEVGDELIDLAAETLRREASQRARQFGGQQVTYYYSSNPSEVRFRSPEEFLARTAWQGDDWSRIDDSLLAELEQAPVKEPFQRLQRLARLYRCGEDEFLEVATELVRRSRGVTNRGTADNEPIAAVVDAWGDRHSTVDIEPLVWQQAKQEINSPNHYQACGFLMRYIGEIGGQGDIGRTLAVLDEAATLYVGPPEQRADFVKRHYQPNQVSWGSPNGKIYVWRQALQQMIQNEQLVFAVLRHLEPYGDAMHVDNLEYYARNAFQKLPGDAAEKLMTALEQCSWLGDVDEFQPLDFGGSRGDAPLASLMQLIGQNDSRGQKFKELLAERQTATPTFGAGLLLAAVSQDENPTSLLDYLGQHLEALSGLPDERQRLLAMAFGNLDRGDSVPHDGLNDDAAAAQKWLENYRADYAQQQANDLLSAKRLEELGIEYYNMEEYLAERIPKLLAGDPATAREGFFKVLDLAEDSQRRGQWQRSYSDGNTLEGNVLAGMFNRSRNDTDSHLQMLTFLADVLSDKRGRDIEINNSGWYAIQRYVQQSFYQVRQESRNQRPSSSEIARRLYDRLAELLGDRPGSVLISGVSQLFEQQVNDNDRYQVDQWLDEIREQDSHPAIADDWHAAIQLAVAARSRRGFAPGVPLPRQELAEHHAYLGRLLDDAELPLTWRMHLAKTILDGEYTGMPVETALACLRVYNEALVEKTPIPNEQQGPLLELASSLVDEPAAAEQLAQWRENWAGRYLRNVRVRNQYQFNPHQLRDNAALCRALALYLLSDDAEHVESVLRYHESPLGTNRTALGLLVRHGKQELAARLFRASWAGVDVHREDPGVLRFDADLRDQLPAFLDQLSGDADRYLAESLLSSLPDDQSLEGTDGNRRARMVQLARRYAGLTLDAAHKNRVLEIFTTDDEAARVVADAIGARYDELDLMAAAGSNDRQRLDQMMHIVAQHCRNRFRDSDPTPLVETIAKFTRYWTGDDYELGRVTEPLVRCALDSVREDGGSWSPAQCAAVGKALRQILTGREQLYLNYFRQYNTMLLLTHARSGDVGELSQWYEKLGDNERNWLPNQSVERQFWSICKSLFPDPSEENLSERMQFVRGALRGAVTLEFMQWNANQPFRFRNWGGNQTILHDVVNEGLLTEDEVPMIALEIVEGENNDFTVAASVASWLADKDQHDGAIMLWRKALEAATDEQVEQRAFAQLGLVSALRSAGSTAAAVEKFAEIDERKVPPSLRGRYENLKKELAEVPPAEEPAAEEAPDEEHERPTSEAEQAADELLDAILNE